jgi:hypothetical protein
MKPRHAVLFLYLFFVPPCFAQAVSGEKPDKPQPAGHVVDKEFQVEAAVLGGAWMADTISTHSAFAGSPRNMEGGLLFYNSRSTPQVMGAWAAVDVGTMFAAYEWKKHVHNRYLHPLWRVIPAVAIIGHTRSAVINSELPAVR